jgi:hypothetical protein
MDDFVTFDNKFLVLRNPLPPVNYQELHDRAKVRLTKHRMAKRDVFDLELRWGGGEDLKTHTLRPGQWIKMPEKQAREIAADFKPSGELCGTNPGLAVYVDGSSAEEQRSAILEALSIAETHYHVLGAQQIDKLRGQFGHTDEQVEKRYRNSTYKSFYLAMAKEEIIRETREKLEKAPQGK